MKAKFNEGDICVALTALKKQNGTLNIKPRPVLVLASAQQLKRVNGKDTLVTTYLCAFSTTKVKAARAEAAEKRLDGNVYYTREAGDVLLKGWGRRKLMQPAAIEGVFMLNKCNLVAVDEAEFLDRKLSSLKDLDSFQGLKGDKGILALEIRNKAKKLVSGF